MKKAKAVKISGDMTIMDGALDVLSKASRSDDEADIRRVVVAGLYAQRGVALNQFLRVQAMYEVHKEVQDLLD